MNLMYACCSACQQLTRTKPTGIDSLIERNKMSKIKGNGDGPGGRNDTYNIGSRREIPRAVLVKEVKAGKHPDTHVIKVNGKEFVRDNPDQSTKDNVNPK